MQDTGETRKLLRDEAVRLYKLFIELKAKEGQQGEKGEVLQNSGELYEYLVQSTDTPSVIIDEDGRVVEASKQYIKLTGHNTIDEIRGWNTNEWTVEYDRQRSRNEIKKFTKVGVIRCGQIDRYISPHGVITLEMAGILLTSNQETKILVVCKDITDTERFFSKIIESEERYRTVIEYSNDGIAIIRRGRFVYVNQKFIKIFGYNQVSEIEGKPVYVIVHPDDREMVTKYNLLRRKKLPAPTKYDFKGIRKDGTLIDLEASPTITKYRGDVVTLLYISDITERRREENSIDKINKCLLSFGPNPDLNIKRIIETTDLNFKGFWTFYSRRGDIISYKKSKQEIPEDFIKNYGERGHIGYATMSRRPSKLLIINELDKTPYALIDPAIRTYRLKTCLSCAVSRDQEILSALCVFYQENKTFNSFDLKIFSILARALSVEEERRGALEELRKNQRMLEISERNLREFSRKILSIREEEKKKLSGALHDEIGSMAVALGSNLSIIEQEIEENNFKGILKSFKQTRKALKRSIDCFKRIALDLRPLNLEMLGLPSAVREYLYSIAKLTDIKIDFNDALGGRHINEQAAIILYRITQEALNNIIRHAEATKVKIDLSDHGNTIKIDIYDNGQGFNVEKVLYEPLGKKMGILGMRESIKSIGGSINIKSELKQGTEIHVALPN